MRAFRNPATAILLVLTLALSTGALADVLDAPARTRARPTFHVRGSVRGLYPGRIRQIRVRVSNRFDFAIRVVEITPHVRRPYAGCPRRSVRIRAWQGSRRIAAQRTRIFRLRVRMRPGAPNACQGARYPIRYRAQAVKAAQR